MKWKVSSFLKAFLKKHLIIFLFLVLSVFLTALSSLLPPYILRYIIDNYFVSSSPEKNLVLISVLYFLSYFLVCLFNVLETYLINLFGQKMVRSLRYQMLEKMDKLPPSYFSDHGSGELQSRLMDDVYAIESLFASGLVSVLISLIKIVGILFSVFFFSYMLGLILVILLPLIYLLTRWFRKAMLKRHLETRRLTNEQSEVLSENIDNNRTVQNLSEEEYEESRYSDLLEKSYRARNHSAVYDSIYSPIITMIKTLVIALITLLVYYGSKNSDFLSLGISVGTYAASLTFISDIFDPITSLGQEIESMQEGVSGVKRVTSFFNEKEMGKKENWTASQILSTASNPLLSIQNLSFRYPDGEENVFTSFSFSIQEGEKVTIQGRTGAGKTTLFKLILGIETPTEGKILLKGYDVSLIPDSEKREIFGYVPQGFHPIRGTIQDQITLKDRSISKEEVKRALNAVFLDDYIQEHIEKGYDAEFEEKDFSRGQLQLFSLARALVKNPKILLLDEISANLDSNTEKEIMAALSLATEKRTCLSISHRLSDQLGFTRTVEIK